MKNKLTTNIIFSLILQIVTILYGIIVPRLIIGKYGSEVNGLIVSITQFLGYIVLLEAGIGPVLKAALYKPIIEKDKLKIEMILKSGQKFFKKIAYIFIIYIIGLVFILPYIIKSNFENTFIISLIFIMAIGKLCEYFFGMLYTLYLQAEQKNYVTSIIRILIYVINIIIIMCIINYNVSIIVIQIILAITFILKPLIQNIYVNKKFNININSDKKEYKLDQKWDALIHHIAHVINWNTDVIVLTIFTSLNTVSVYSIYTLILTGIKSILTAITSVIESFIGQSIAKENTEKLRNNFRHFEIIYFSMLTIIYSMVYLTIIPFVKVYTNGLNDTNYIKPMFAILMTTAYLIYSIRVGYTTLVFSAGHFKQTSKGAWYEAIINIIFSIALVIKFGIIGVAIGTGLALLYRAIEFLIYANKNILKSNIWESIRINIIMTIEIILIIIISNYLFEFEAITYVSWIIYAVQVGIVSILIVGLINSLAYKTEITNIVNKIKRRNLK